MQNDKIIKKKSLKKPSQLSLTRLTCYLWHEIGIKKIRLSK